MDNNTKKIVLVGRATIDFKWFLNDELHIGEKQRGVNFLKSPGGPSASAAATSGVLAKEHNDNILTYFIGAVGDDLEGKFVLNQLNLYGVNTNYVLIKEGIHTSAGGIIVDTDGERTIVSYQDPDLKLDNIESIDADVLEFDGQELEASLKIMSMNPNAISILDAGRLNPDVKELARRVDYVVCSKDFAEKYVRESTGDKNFNLNDLNNISIAYSVMEKEFPNNIIITIGKKGCVFKDRLNEEIILVPPTNDKAVDSTGAGDIFHGAFAYAMARKFDLYDSLKFSIIVSGLSVTKPGGITSIPTIDDINLGWMLYDNDPDKKSQILFRTKKVGLVFQIIDL